MGKLLGCTVTDELFAAWSRLLVFEREPLFLTEEARSLLPPGTLILTEREFLDNYAVAPLELRDSYDLYRMKREFTAVALVSAAELRSLTPAARIALLRLQCDLGRGQIYSESFVRATLAGFPAALTQFAPYFFDGPDERKVALDYDLWMSLPVEAQQEWLSRVVPAEDGDCLSASFSEDDWDKITRKHGPAIRALAGTFAPRSGPNCFGLALAAVTPLHQALTVADVWLHQPPFLRGLAERGLTPRPLPTDVAVGEIPPGVLVWSNDAGLPQHACYVLGDGLALNKQAQSWFRPRQILPVASVIESWRPNGYTLTLHKAK